MLCDLGVWDCTLRVNTLESGPRMWLSWMSTGLSRLKALMRESSGMSESRKEAQEGHKLDIQGGSDRLSHARLARQ